MNSNHNFLQLQNGHTQNEIGKLQLLGTVGFLSYYVKLFLVIPITNTMQYLI